MRVQHSFLMGAALFSLAACQHMGLGGGQGERDWTPTVTRTGEVKDIIIRDDDVSPAIVTANPGDEIRWVNNRQGHARVRNLSFAGGWAVVLSARFWRVDERRLELI